jgi:hypothetical protein
MAKLTVFDNLPLDVIKFEIFPSLNYDERINLNQCLPPQDRISKKMLKASIEKHERDILVKTIKKYLDYNDSTRFLWYEDEGSRLEHQLQNMIGMFILLQKPRYFALIAKYPIFRACVLDKIISLVQQLIELNTPVELGIRVKLASELKNLRNKIDTSGPYIHHTVHTAPHLSFQ